MLSIDERVELLMRGTEYGDSGLGSAMREELRERLIESDRTGVPLRVYCGYDPTSSDLHLGHTISMRKLKQFQDLGNEVYFLIGSFTSLIGDPSGKDKARPLVSKEEVFENGRTYAEQAFRVLDRAKTKVVYNSDWLEKVTLEEIFHIATHFTAQQILARDNFARRMESGEPIHLHEFFYPLSQGYDAHHLEADVQVGGNDQLYNIVTASRKVMEAYGQKPNIGILMPLLPGTDGVQKMSKSLGNTIPIHTNAEDMYGKVMSIPDATMPLYATLTTEWSNRELAAFETGLETGSLHPRDAKMQLAYEITRLFYGDAEASAAQDQFVATFQKGDIPDEMPEYMLEGDETILDILVANAMAGSKSQARRLIDQQGVKLDGVTVTDAWQRVENGGVLQAGKRHFLRIKKAN